MMETEDLSRSLAQHPFVKQLEESHIAFLAGCTKNVRFSPGEYLVHENTPANTLYLVRSGKISLEIHAPGRGAVPVETIDPGEVLGWSVVFAPNQWHIDARALEPTLTFAIDGVCLRNKLTADHSFGYAIVHGLLIEVHRRLERARLAQLDVYGGANK